jgi:membrane protein implicated in regulation of membrane protease activity
VARGLYRLFAIAVFTLSLVGSAFADEVKGTISKVGEEGREITVKDKAGKEIEVKISGSRTKIEGAKSRSDLKEGQSVTVEHEKGEAKNIKVAK